MDTLQFALVFLATVTVFGCASEGGATGSSEGSTQGTSPATACGASTPVTNLSTPSTSFRKEVLPIFAKSCAFTSCHGSASGRNNGVYLGPDAARTYGSTVRVASAALPAMSIVAPGDPGASFVMHKLDGDLCTLQAQCTGGTCGEPMPRGSAPLSAESRDVVRRWIAQGAKDD